MQKNETLLIVAFLAVLFVFLKPSAGAAMSPDFNRWDALFKKYGAQYGVPWRWLKAICMIESSLGAARSVARGLAVADDVEGSKSTDGLSWGIMQVTLKTARALEGMLIQPPYLNDPENSVRLASKVMEENIRRFGISDRESIIRAYNGGPRFGAATIPYYAKFMTALAVVMKAHPGKETEI